MFTTTATREALPTAGTWEIDPTHSTVEVVARLTPAEVGAHS